MAGSQESLTLPRREPTIRMWHPDWWIDKGIGMHVSEKAGDATNERLVVKASAAELVITRRTDKKHPKVWWVDWKVVHGPEESDSGTIGMDERDLKAAFDINGGDPGAYPEDMLERFGGDSASVGKYIRSKGFLNIPGPRTETAKATPLSIEINDGIKLGVSRLLFS